MRHSTLLIIGITSVLLVGLYLWLDQKAAKAPEQTAFNWEITNNNLLGPKTANVVQGQKVTLNILADFEDTVHLHGYEITQKTDPMNWVQIKFEAEHTGRFILELHDRQAILGAVQILPE